MKERRNIVCKVRLNDEEQQLFNRKAESYGGNTSAMIRDAVAQFNDKKSRGKIQTISELQEYYKEYQQKLSWYGCNFNQAMHRANELAATSQMSQQYFHTVYMQKSGGYISNKGNEHDTRQPPQPNREAMIITILPKSTIFHTIIYNEKKVSQGLADD